MPLYPDEISEITVFFCDVPAASLLISWSLSYNLNRPFEFGQGGNPLTVKSYFVFQGGVAAGPLHRADIEKKLKSRELLYTDFIWVENAWQMLANFFAADFPAPTEAPPGEVVVANAPKGDLRTYTEETFSEAVGISNEPIWFLYRDNTKFGPYRFLELVRLLQTNSCSRDDFVWKPGYADWQRVRQCQEFEEPVLDKLSHLKQIGLEKVFIQRRFPRVPYASEVILHDEKRVVFGSAKSLSEGGAFVEVAKPSHAKGDRIKIHFTPGAVAVPFNCIAEITQVMKGDPSGYNVKFIYLEEDDRKRIAQYADSVS